MQYSTKYYNKHRERIAVRENNKYATNPEYRRKKMENAKRYYHANKKLINEKKKMPKEEPVKPVSNLIDFKQPVSAENIPAYRLTTPEGKTFIIPIQAGKIEIKTQRYGNAVFATNF